MKRKSRLDFYRHSTRHAYESVNILLRIWLLEFHGIVISSYWFGKHNDIWFYALEYVCVCVCFTFISPTMSSFVNHLTRTHHVQYKIYWYECDVCRKSSGIPALIPPGESAQNREENHLFNRFLFRLTLSHSVAFHNHLHLL